MRIDSGGDSRVVSYSRPEDFSRYLPAKSSAGSARPVRYSHPAEDGPPQSTQGLGKAPGGLFGASNSLFHLGQVLTYGFSITDSEASDQHTIITIQAGSNADNIQVTQGSDGTVTITDNGKTSYTFKVRPGTVVIINGGDGNDTINTTGTNVGAKNQIVLNGNGGNDVITGGSGNDYIDGGQGDDTLSGGQGKDVIYGGYGADKLNGGAGADYLDGGQDNDIVKGGAGADVLSGGRGDDRIEGGAGSDVLITTFGNDTVVDRGNGGRDTIYAKTDDKLVIDSNSRVVIVDPNAAPGGRVLGSSITVDGSDAFKDRIDADLDTMRGMPLGQTMLASLDASGHDIEISEFNDSNGGAQPMDGLDLNPASPDADGTPGEGIDVRIVINPALMHLYSDVTAEWADTPPIVVLFHEMAHAEDMVHGTLIPGNEWSTNQGGPAGGPGVATARNNERSAVGLPYDQDGDKATNETNTRDTTENHFREELGLPLRPYY